MGRRIRPDEPAAAKSQPPIDEAPPKQWEIRAALRAFARSRESSGRRNPAEAMVEAGWELVSLQDDFTVKQVTERAGVALQTFYRHFGSKDELLLAMLEESIGRSVSDMEAEAALLPDPVARLKYMVTRPVLREYDEQGVRGLRWRARERLRISHRFPQAEEAVHGPYRDAVHKAILDAHDAGALHSDHPALHANLIQHLVMTMTHAVHGGGVRESPEEVAEALWQLVWDGLRPRDD